MFQHIINGSALFPSLESRLFSSIAWPEAYMITHCRIYFIKTTYLRLSTILHRLMWQSGFHAVDSVFQLLHSNLCENFNSRFQSFLILDSLTFITDSKAQDFGFLKWIFNIPQANITHSTSALVALRFLLCFGLFLNYNTR